MFFLLCCIKWFVHKKSTTQSLLIRWCTRIRHPDALRPLSFANVMDRDSKSRISRSSDLRRPFLSSFFPSRTISCTLRTVKENGPETLRLQRRHRTGFTPVSLFTGPTFLLAGTHSVKYITYFFFSCQASNIVNPFQFLPFRRSAIIFFCNRGFHRNFLLHKTKSSWITRSFSAVDRGIEPLFSPWEGDVLTAWPIDHVSFALATCLVYNSFRRNASTFSLFLVFLQIHF